MQCQFIIMSDLIQVKFQPPELESLTEKNSDTVKQADILALGRLLSGNPSNNDDHMLQFVGAAAGQLPGRTTPKAPNPCNPPVNAAP